MKSIIYIVLTLTVIFSSGCANLKNITNNLIEATKKSTSQTVSVASKIVDTTATKDDIKDFLLFIRFYDLTPDYAQKVFFIKQKIKNKIPVSTLKLSALQEEVQENCKKIKKKSILLARVRASYLLGDSNSITVKIAPINLFFKNTKKYIPKDIVLKKGEDKLIKLPPGFYNIIATAKFKRSTTRLCAAMEDDDFQLFYITYANSDKIKAIDNTNTIPITNGDGYLYVKTKKLNAIFTLTSNLLIKPERKNDENMQMKTLGKKLDVTNLSVPKMNDVQNLVKKAKKTAGVSNSNKELSVIDKALIRKFPELKAFYTSEVVQGEDRVYRYIYSLKGEKSVSLPAPLLIQLPAGKYLINGKDVTIEIDKLSIINL